ncbi:MAG: KH domain-containing protein [Candidatus Nomurabacteria bacterium]|jgi:predicted RNA-binding protein YlqC (UPF0109 family)|nr:KH domain-containing protein [Candidatus Nomurabacteria bacterium]
MATTIDQQFVEYIVKTLVNNPDKVEIQRDIDEKGVLLSLTVDPEDIGRVIGKRGATAQSIRTLLRALGTKNDARYNLKIVNNDDYVPRERNSDYDRSSTAGVVDTVSEEPVATSDDAVENSPENSELAEKTRQELADLDDLDI